MICPRCTGTGKEWGGHMICATCHGKGETDEEICPKCRHPMSSHDKLEHAGVLDCYEESASGQFICGCSGPDGQVKPICNVCGKEHGNLFCLNRHLGWYPECKKNYVPTFYKWG